jgi:hypothetical protein
VYSYIKPKRTLTHEKQALALRILQEREEKKRVLAQQAEQARIRQEQEEARLRQEQAAHAENGSPNKGGSSMYTVMFDYAAVADHEVGLVAGQVVKVRACSHVRMLVCMLLLV